MITPEFLEDLEGFSLIIRKRITSKYSGSRVSLQSGRGIQIKEHRPYTRGDDIRTIDWKVYARTDDLFVKIFEEDRDLSVHVIVDMTASMEYGPKIRKIDYASMLAAGFLFLAMRENERFRYAFMRENLEVHPLNRGRTHFARFVNDANQARPEGKMGIVDMVDAYKPLLTGKSMIIIISDFLFPADDVEYVLGNLRRHEVKLVRVLHPDEVSLPLEGDYLIIDAESRDELRTHLSMRERAEYENRLREHSAQIEKACMRLGFDYHFANANEPIFDAFFRMIS